MNKSKRGFTLIELLVVIGIIGILAALVLVALGNARTRAQDTRVRSGLSQLRVLAEAHFDSNNHSYEDFDDCVLGTGTDPCAGDIETEVNTLRGDINEAAQADLEATADANNFCIAAQLNVGDTWLSVDQTGAFSEGASNPCT